jgi:DNA (cytosine-5)-methyltransferase 1
MLKVLDLFAGIGGFSLGLERTGGFETIGFCEVDKKAQAVLKKHWPEVPIYDDVTKLTKDDIDGTVDVITGGFPCQDISLAGKGAGLEGERSGLWWEFHRLIKELQPKWVIAENVSALRSRGLDQVLRSLSEIGYDAEWHCIPASAVGAPHRRDRIWIVAYPNLHDGRHGSSTQPYQRETRMESGSSGSGLTEREAEQNVAHSGIEGSQGRLHRWANTQRQSQLGYFGCSGSMDGQQIKDWWTTEPNVGRVAHGIPKRVDRIKQLGNAVVPQIPELIGRVILNN